MDTRQLTEAAWKAVAQKHRVKDNGLQRALADYAKLARAPLDERTGALDRIEAMAVSLSRDKAVAEQAEVVKVLKEVAAAAGNAKKHEARADAAVRRPDLRPALAAAKLAQAAKEAVKKLPAAPGQLKGGANACLGKEATLAMAAAAAAVAGAAVVASAPVTAITEGVGLPAALAAMAALVAALAYYVERIDELIICYQANPEAYRDRIQRLETLRRTYSAHLELLRRALEQLRRFQREHPELWR